MDPINKSLLEAAHELIHEHSWTLDDESNGDMPQEDSTFIRILHKHIAPLVNTSDWREARIAALNAELAALTGEPT